MDERLKIAISWPDLVVILSYLLGIVGLGVWAWHKRRRQDASSAAYFLAGSSLRWPVIGLALFSANISTTHLVSLAQEGYVNGLAYGNFEWMAAFLLIVLSLFFAPFYIRSRVATLPDFLEKRYSPACRDWLAGLSIVSAVFIHIGFSLYTGAVVLKGLFGIDISVSIAVTAALTGDLYDHRRAARGRADGIGADDHPHRRLGLRRHHRARRGRRLERSGGGRRTGQAHRPADGGRDSFAAVVCGLPGLSGHRPMVLVRRPDDRPAGARRQGREPRPDRAAVHRFPQNPAGFSVRPSRGDRDRPHPPGEAPGDRGFGGHVFAPHQQRSCRSG